MNIQEAEAKLKRVIVASGYIEMCLIAKEGDRDCAKLKKEAIKALNNFSDDDEAIDAMYDYDHTKIKGEKNE